MGDKKVFRFKEFSVHHDECAMKVGTDAVLLATWTNIAGARSILDIGTGSGVIALILAQRSNPEVKIDAVEIAEKDATQARQNFNSSPWTNRLRVHHTPIQSFLPEYHYDHIISNPPFFTNSYRPPGEGRSGARHTQSLSHDTLINTVLKLLTPAGSFDIILPYTEGNAFLKIAGSAGLFCQRKTIVYAREMKPVERQLLSFSQERRELVIDDLVMHVSDGHSEAYKDLTRDFYLNF